MLKLQRAAMILPMLLGACATAPSEGQLLADALRRNAQASTAIAVAQPARAPACPREATYSAAFMRGAAGELDKLPASNPIAIMIVDYGKLRDQARVCRGEKR